MTDLNAYEDELRAELGRMTTKELRGFAREHHVPLAGASSKQQLVSEIVGQMRHWEYLRQCEERGVRP